MCKPPSPALSRLSLRWSTTNKLFYLFKKPNFVYTNDFFKKQFNVNLDMKRFKLKEHIKASTSCLSQNIS